jgi:molybdopterin/thiamine biosynthesis adenylyltransferase
MSLNRYRRQTLVNEFGHKGQEILAKKHAVVIGGGGLGSHSADLLVRMGIGSIDIVDNDIVDITNLHRTSVFSEYDIGKSKALILQEKLQAINSDVRVRGIKRVVINDNIEALVRGADIIVDGTDSMSLRFLINNVSIKRDIPWVYAGVYETVGMVMGILPGKTPCFQCISQTIPELSYEETPVLGSLPSTIASIQCNEAIKLLLGKSLVGLIIYDVWKQCFETMDIKRNPQCPMCSMKK